MPESDQESYSPQEHQRMMQTRAMEGLRRDAALKRSRVSATAADMIEFCHKNLAADPLIFSVKENPFKEKKSCIVL